MDNVCFQSALGHKLCLADRTHISRDTGMHGHVIVVISAFVILLIALITDLASEFY